MNLTEEYGSSARARRLARTYPLACRPLESISSMGRSPVLELHGVVRYPIPVSGTPMGLSSESSALRAAVRLESYMLLTDAGRNATSKSQVAVKRDAWLIFTRAGNTGPTPDVADCVAWPVRCSQWASTKSTTDALWEQMIQIALEISWWCYGSRLVERPAEQRQPPWKEFTSERLN